MERDGKKTARKRIVASLAWELLTAGQAVLPNGKTLVLDPQDWLGLLKWVYQHIDGPPKSEIDVTSGNERISITYVNDWRTQQDTGDEATDGGG